MDTEGLVALITEVMSDEQVFVVKLYNADCLLLVSLLCEAIPKTFFMGVEPESLTNLTIHLMAPLVKLHPNIRPYLVATLHAALQVRAAH